MNILFRRFVNSTSLLSEHQLKIISNKYSISTVTNRHLNDNWLLYRLFFIVHRRYSIFGDQKSTSSNDNRSSSTGAGDYDIFGNVRNAEDLRNTKRKSGRGYSNFANSVYEHRPYVWEPMRRIHSILWFGICVMVISLLLGFDPREWPEQMAMIIKDQTDWPIFYDNNSTSIRSDKIASDDTTSI